MPKEGMIGASMKQNPQVAVQFLQFLYPEGPWLLTAIPVERSEEAPPTKTFYPGDDVAGWMEQYYGGDYNFYFSVNRPLRDMNKKAKRLDIGEMRFLHVDLDPRTPPPDADKAQFNLDEKHRIEKLLTDALPEGIPQPSALVDSGGGYWGFWRLKEPFPIAKRAENYEEAKLYNLHLETVLGADSCHNVDRIARLPGTINYPDLKKQKKGRVESVARVLYTNDNVYNIAEFTKAPQVQAKRDGFSTGRTITISENVQRLQSLEELPKGVTDFTKVVIAQGCDPDDPNRFADSDGGGLDRSDALWYVCCELVRQGCDDDTIYSVITDPDWAISESVVDGSNGRGDGYARRQIERAREYAVDPKLADFNNRYAVVQNTGGGSCRVVYEEVSNGNRIMVLQTPGDFKAFYANEFVTVPNAAGNGTISKPAGKWWFEHPMRRSYRAIVFQPGQEVADDVYNLWRGFAYEAVPGGKCDLFLQHVRDVICGEDAGLFEYVMNWMALGVQQPWNPGHTAIVLRGGQGAGKGTFAKAYAKLFGRHGKQITDAKHLTGHFNAHLRDCVVLFADEAVAAADAQQESMLKTLVTEESLMVTPKGKEASVERNYLHVIMASNSDWVVPIGVDDRRFVMLDVPNIRKEDPEYWRALNRELENGGYQALLYLLATRNLSGYDPRKRPQTAALQEQKTLSFSPIAKWWYNVLSEGQLGDLVLTNRTTVPTGYITYEFNSLGHRERCTPSQMFKFLHRVLPRREEKDLRRQLTHKEAEGLKVPAIHFATGQPLTSSRPNCYFFPPLLEMRDAFDESMGGPYTWPAIPEVEEDHDAF